MLSGLASARSQPCGIDKQEVGLVEPVLERAGPTRHSGPQEGPSGGMHVKVSSDISRENSVKGGM